MTPLDRINLHTAYRFNLITYEQLQKRVELFNQDDGTNMETSHLVNDLLRENKRLLAEIAELREALMPFAQAADDHMEQHQIAAEVGGYVCVDDNAEICVPITFGECSRARAKLEGSGA